MAEGSQTHTLPHRTGEEGQEHQSALETDTPIHGSTVIKRRELPRTCLVVPCFNEQAVLPITLGVLIDKLESLTVGCCINKSSAILFVDDGSTDSTWKLIAQAHARHPKLVHGIRLAHNRGHQNALLAGLMTALSDDYDAAISLDADLQDDINVLDEFIKEYRAGAEIVYGVRSSRATDSWFKRNTAEAFYALNAKLGAETVKDHADYRLMSRKALEALAEYHEVNLFLRGIVPTLGFRTAIVTYERRKREAGESKYPLRKMIALAMQGITSFSVKPLHFVAFAGVASILLGLAMFIYVIVSWANNDVVSGWGSIMCSIWLIGGLLMVSMGIVGEYIGKIYLETKRRPRYIVDERI